MVASRAKAFIKHILTRQLTSRLEFEEAIAVKPVSEVFGIDRSVTLNRIFISRFLQLHQEIIRGNCFEVKDPVYTW